MLVAYSMSFFVKDHIKSKGAISDRKWEVIPFKNTEKAGGVAVKQDYCYSFIMYVFY